MYLVIDQKRACIVKEAPFVYDLGNTVNALGNVVHCLNLEFPGIEQATDKAFANRAIRTILQKLDSDITSQNDFQSNSDTHFNKAEIWGLNVSWLSAHSAMSFLQNKSEIKLSLNDAEILRLRHRTKSVMPLDWDHKNVNYEDGLIINDITQLADIFYGLIYYYAFHGLNLKKCEHCGRWFATTTFKQKYCSRNSLFSGYTHLGCEQAVRNIMQNCRRIKNRIETKATEAMRGRDNYLCNFQQECEPLYQAAKKVPTTENLEIYHTFLKKAEKAKGWLNQDSR